MSKEQCVSCSRSASDGNLADAEDDNHEKQYEGKLGIADHRKCEIENRRFCTLPRLPYRRKSSRRKIKEIKVDVPFNASDEFRKDAGRVLPSSKKEEKKKSEHRSILSKLFRRHTTAAQTPVSPITCGHTHAKSNTSTRRSISYLMSASNTDIRSHMIISESSDYQEYFKDKTPAVCGIKNHGNTCFMNAVVQCLSNTDFFAEYLVMDQYKVDFHRRNKIHSKKFGTRGEVTEQLAIVLKSLWSCQYCTDVSQKFKTLVAKYGRQYEGTDQHDAQEFLLWLLDKVHEDLNTATKQKYKKPKNSYGRPDEDVAAETLANHLRCNNSFVHDLFQGQFRSSLSCPGCCRYSNTFDPYLCVSLPVPHHQTIPVIINLVPFGEDVKAIKLGLTMDSQASIKELCEKLSSEYNVAKQRILITEISQGKFLRTFRDFDIMATLPENEVYAIELPSLKSVSNADGEYLTLVIINQVNNGAGGKNEMFWRPIVVQVLREATFKEIQKQILTAMGSIIKDKLCLEKSEPLFQLLVIDDVPDQDILPYSVDHPLYMPVVDQVLMLCDGEYSKCLQHLKLAAEWSQNLKESIIVDELCIEEQASVAKVKEMHSKIPNVSLYECFNLYFTEEKLDLEDAWMCPYCHQRLQGIKQLSLWTVPDVFIVHLKRFRQSLCQRTKVTTLVEFPNLGLDMNFYIAKRNHGLHHNVPNGSMGSLAFWSPWKRPSARPYHRNEDNAYDLYAVCNHHGSMQGGHYTAYCKNSVDGRWYLFDDTKVQAVQESDVVTADAYILFYQRSSLFAHSCASSSTSGYSTASSVSLMTAEHWAFRMPPFLHMVPKTSKSQDNLCDVASPSTLERRSKSENRPFVRSGKAYSSMSQFSDMKKISTCEYSESERHSDGEVHPDDIPPPPPPPSKRYWTITSV